MTHPAGRKNNKYAVEVHGRHGFPSVTTVIGVLNKPALSFAAAKETALYAVHNRREWQHLAPAHAVDKLKRRHREVWDEKANRGTTVHDLANSWSQGDEVDVTEDCVPYMDALEAFYRDWRPSWVEVERTVIYRGAKPYGGSFDAIADLADGNRYLLDIKGLALNTPIPTPTGWTTMGAIQPGDLVFGSDGVPTPVLHKSEVRDRPCYRVKFDDGSDVICDDEHRWPVEHMATGVARVMTTVDLAADLKRRVGRQRRMAVVNALPLCLPPVDLPLDPYLFGAWIGDGTRRRPVLNISVAKAPIAEAFVKAGFPARQQATRSGSLAVTYSISGLLPVLRELGQVDGDKFIPDIYLRSSFMQRLSLLQGLMDTDGTWHRTRNQAIFTSTDKSIAAAVYELVVSLGWRASQNSHPCTGFGLTVTAHTVSFTPVCYNPFRLVAAKRELAGPRVAGTANARRRMIKEVIPTLPVPTQCIAVGGDHTYLCGEQMVPTHNTGTSVWDEVALQLAAYRYAEHFGIYDETGDLIDTEPMIPVDRCGVIHLKGDGTYGLVPVQAGRDEWAYFMACRELWEFVNTKTKSKRIGAPLPVPKEVSA